MWHRGEMTNSDTEIIIATSRLYDAPQRPTRVHCDMSVFIGDPDSLP